MGIGRTVTLNDPEGASGKRTYCSVAGKANRFAQKRKGFTVQRSAPKGLLVREPGARLFYQGVRVSSFCRTVRKKALFEPHSFADSESHDS
jgi:hypothetical protein